MATIAERRGLPGRPDGPRGGASSVSEATRLKVLVVRGPRPVAVVFGR